MSHPDKRATIDCSTGTAYPYVKGNARRVSLRSSRTLRRRFTATPPVQEDMEGSLLIRELLLLDAERMHHLREDWMLLGKKLSRVEFVFLVSKHVGRYGPLENDLLEKVPQKRILSALMEAFDEINSYRAEKDVVDWASFSNYLITSARLIRPANAAKADSSMSSSSVHSLLKPLPLPMREQRRLHEEATAAVARTSAPEAPASAQPEDPRRAAAASSLELAALDVQTIRATPYKVKKTTRKVASMHYLPLPVDKLIVCDHPHATRALDDEEEDEVVEHCRLALWHIAQEATEIYLYQLLHEDTSMLYCATVAAAKGADAEPDDSDLLVPRACTLATANTSQRQVLLWKLLCPPGAITTRQLKVQSQCALTTDDLICAIVHTYTAQGSSVLFAGSFSGGVCSWDLTIWPGRPLHTFSGHSDQVSSLVLIPHLELVASGSLDRTLRLWNLNTGKSGGVPMEAHTRGVTSIVFVVERQLLLSSGNDRVVYVWNLLLQEKITALTGHQDPVLSVVVAASLIVSADAGHAFRVWDMVSFSCVQQFSLPGNCILPFSSLSSVVVPNEQQPSLIVVVGVPTLLLGSPVDVPAESQTALVFSPRFLRMISASASSLRVWEAQTGRLLCTLSECASSHITALCLDHTERCCFVGEHNGQVGMVNLSSGQVVRKMPPHDRELVVLTILRSWGSGGKDNRRGSGQKMAQFGGEERRGELEKHGALLLSMDNQLVHVSSVYEGVLLFKLSVSPGVGGGLTPHSSAELTALCTSVNSLSLVCVGTSNGTLQLWKVWDVRTVRVHSTSRAWGAEVSAACFTPTVRPLLVAADVSSTITLWDAVTRKLRPLSRWFQNVPRAAPVVTGKGADAADADDDDDDDEPPPRTRRASSRGHDDALPPHWKRTPSSAALATASLGVAPPSPSGCKRSPSTAALHRQPTASLGVAPPSPSGCKRSPSTAALHRQPTASLGVAPPSPSGCKRSPSTAALHRQPTASLGVAPPSPSGCKRSPSTAALHRQPTASLGVAPPSPSGCKRSPSTAALHRQPTASLGVASSPSPDSLPSSCKRSPSTAALHRPTSTERAMPQLPSIKRGASFGGGALRGATAEARGGVDRQPSLQALRDSFARGGGKSAGSRHSLWGAAEASKPLLSLSMAVTELVIDQVHSTLFSGDESGNVCKWDLGTLLRELEATRQQQGAARGSDEDEGGEEGAWSDDDDEGETDSFASSVHALPRDKAEPLPMCIGCWRTHPGAVHAMALVEDRCIDEADRPCCILLTASRDGTIAAWVSSTPTGSPPRGRGAAKLGQLTVSRCQMLLTVTGMPRSLLHVHKQLSEEGSGTQSPALVRKLSSLSRLTHRTSAQQRVSLLQHGMEGLDSKEIDERNLNWAVVELEQKEGLAWTLPLDVHGWNGRRRAALEAFTEQLHRSFIAVDAVLHKDTRSKKPELAFQELRMDQGAHLLHSVFDPFKAIGDTEALGATSTTPAPRPYSIGPRNASSTSLHSESRSPGAVRYLTEKAEKAAGRRSMVSAPKAKKTPQELLAMAQSILEDHGIELPSQVMVDRRGSQAVSHRKSTTPADNVVQ